MAATSNCKTLPQTKRENVYEIETRTDNIHGSRYLYGEQFKEVNRNLHQDCNSDSNNGQSEQDLLPSSLRELL